MLISNGGITNKEIKTHDNVSPHGLIFIWRKGGDDGDQGKKTKAYRSKRTGR